MRTALPRILAICGGVVFATSAFSQDSRNPATDDFSIDFPISIEERYPGIPATTSPLDRSAELVLGDTGNGLPNVMITGYWPPTNEMLRRWSTNPAQNPGGWVGADWEGRGFNVYSFFPEFPSGLGRGEGDFEVDYQDTSADWWEITNIVKPVAIITFSRAGNDRGWEMEGGNRVYPLAQWTVDYLAPLRPTPELPSSNEPDFNERFSTLPTQAIADAVNDQVPTLNAFVTVIDNGRFLSNYIGYHGNWYHDLHSDPLDPDWCVTGGHIHVGYQMSLAEAEAATEVTLRVWLDEVTELRALADLNCDGLVSVGDIAPFVLALTDPLGYAALFPDCNIDRADMNADDQISVGDIGVFVAFLTGS